MTPYFSSEMVIAPLGVSHHHFSSLDSQGKAAQDSFQLALAAAPCPSAASPSQTRPASAVALLGAENSIRCLRLDLVEMLRFSLHAVDYATKAYALGRVEFALSALSGRKRPELLRETIMATTQHLYETDELGDSELGFIESARAISAALFSTCQQAYEMSSHTIGRLRGGTRRNSKELVQLGERAARLLRLCIVAFMKQKAEYAEAVQRDVDQWRHGINNKPSGSNCAASVITTDANESSIASSLAKIMVSLCSIAMAVSTTVPLSGAEKSFQEGNVHLQSNDFKLQANLWSMSESICRTVI